jgi:translocator protein
MQAYTWYFTQIKPSWSPPAWLFSPVWTVLYIIIFISFGYVFYKILKTPKDFPKNIALPFFLNLIFNFAFTPIQFGLRNNMLAAVDILLVLITIFWFFKVTWNRVRWVAYVNIPYLLWVLFATCLQFTITYLNH